MHYVIHFVTMCTLDHVKEKGLFIIGLCISQCLGLVGADDIKYCRFGDCINSCNENQMSFNIVRATFCGTSFTNAEICVSVPWNVGNKLCNEECNIT
jgi:hypothetical protein